MQLYALTKDGLPIDAFDAEKQVNYFCPECNGSIRLREGEVKHPHFYHLQKQTHCRQQGKGLIHFHIQKRLQALLQGAILERRFPECGRIADLVWEKEKLIFEVQCSPMDRKEMIARTEDYKKLGYQIVWILHDRRYNQWKVSALERGLKHIPHYFTNINEKGEGVIYDQWSLIEQGIRKEKLSKWPIKPCFIRQEKNQLRDWPFHFEGDLCSFPKDHPEYLRIVASKVRLQKKISYFTIFKNWLSSYWESKLKSYCE